MRFLCRGRIGNIFCSRIEAQAGWTQSLPEFRLCAELMRERLLLRHQFCMRPRRLGRLLIPLQGLDACILAGFVRQTEDQLFSLMQLCVRGERKRATESSDNK